jgi:hypothetical protein
VRSSAVVTVAPLEKVVRAGADMLTKFPKFVIVLGIIDAMVVLASMPVVAAPLI